MLKRESFIPNLEEDKGLLRRQKKPLFPISAVEKIQVELTQHLLQNRNHSDVAKIRYHFGAALKAELDVKNGNKMWPSRRYLKNTKA